MGRCLLARYNSCLPRLRLLLDLIVNFMHFSTPLIPGTLIQRYKRFLADIRLQDGQVVTAHCANPGAMLGVKDPGMPVWVSRSTNPKRKLQYDWQLGQVGDTMIGLNTNLPNKLAVEAIEAEIIPELRPYQSLKTEVKYGQENSRIDILLTQNNDQKTYVEVKNVHLVRQQGLAEFPDSVTARGAKHLRELAAMAKQGHRAVLLFVVQRDDVTQCTVASDLDPNYAAEIGLAQAAGVEILAYACHVDCQEIRLYRQLDFILL